MRVALLTAALVGLVSAAPVLDPHIVHEKRDTLPIAWRHHSRAKPSSLLPVRIGLKQRNLEYGSDLVSEVADPDSPNFGKHRALLRDTTAE